MEDYNLIRNCQKGDKSAFQELIRKYHPLVFKFLYKLSNNYQMSEDLTQDTFLKIIKTIEKFDLSKDAAFSTYILTIAKNCYIDEYRKDIRRKNILTNELPDKEDVTIDVEGSTTNRLYGLEVINKMKDLSEEQQMVIKLKYIEDLTLKEIASLLKLEPKTVKSRIHNGITKLRSLLKGDMKNE